MGESQLGSMAAGLCRIIVGNTDFGFRCRGSLPGKGKSVPRLHFILAWDKQDMGMCLEEDIGTGLIHSNK
jgi:hypothetical protein